VNDKESIWNILFTGVGGQGVLLVAEITALTAVDAGFDVKQTEVHGVSQRGGSVETQVRFGEKVWSPIITPGQANVVVGLEELEALRTAHFTHISKGTILLNQHRLIPASVEDAEEKYPKNVQSFLEKNGYKVISLQATQLAHELGDGRMANVVLLGTLSTLLPIDVERWIATLKRRIPEKYRQANLKAFETGRLTVPTLTT
jgi:indolepyruvate ferredoxin oxidoreductase beta subunit